MNDTTSATCYLHLQAMCAPRQWQAVGAHLAATAGDALGPAGGALYGIWRSQIGRPRDELNIITHWTGDATEAVAASQSWLQGTGDIADHTARAMTPTLRPADANPPIRQGNYAFRSFTTPAHHWQEFLDLCAAAWPGFEAAYDSQVIGLWEIANDTPQMRESLLLTRRPNLAMWERSKLPANAGEAEVRGKLSRRYDLCDATSVHTTTLLTARDEKDEARWT